MKSLEQFDGTMNSNPAKEDTLTIEKLNQCIRDLRVQFPDEFRAAQLRAKYERLLYFCPIPVKFPTNW